MIAKINLPQNWERNNCQACPLSYSVWNKSTEDYDYLCVLGYKQEQCKLQTSTSNTDHLHEDFVKEHLRMCGTCIKRTEDGICHGLGTDRNYEGIEVDDDMSCDDYFPCESADKIMNC